ncbi:D-glycero-beta-D-manno-heptose-7-phosphate kinase [Candidatus Woesearchaeota archaeon]|nr:D-glycero-beta-D-manno-heptose-7-phosphate kinase [Candidatus Woesearchaeota archaeon]
MNNSNIDKIVKQFGEKSILVIGDIMLDEFIFGNVERINPEAPVPILNVKKREIRLGAAANVANNIISLGGNCVLFGMTGDDRSAEKIIKLAKKQKISLYLIKDKNVPTIKKTRAIAQNQHLLRLDFEEKYEPNQVFLDALKELLVQQNFDAILVSDYAKGTITKEVMEILKQANKPIFVDPKPANKEFYEGVFLITPNLKEAKELAKIKEQETEKSSEEFLGKHLCELYSSNILITKSEKGMTLHEKNKEAFNIPTQAKEVYDVTGAGDTVISTLTLAYSCCADLKTSALLSNIAAGISVGKIGTSPVLKEELINELFRDESKIKSLEELKLLINDLKLKNKKIVFTNGCFDILHTGHTRLLNFAKKQGDILILGLNSDDSVKRLKGESRPINVQEKRAEILSNFPQINYITIFEQDTPLELVESLRPDIIVKGGDWKPENVVGNHVAEIRIFNTIEGESTTNIIKKVQEKSANN